MTNTKREEDFIAYFNAIELFSEEDLEKLEHTIDSISNSNNVLRCIFSKIESGLFYEYHDYEWGLIHVLERFSEHIYNKELKASLLRKAKPLTILLLRRSYNENSIDRENVLEILEYIMLNEKSKSIIREASEMLDI